jgi:Asp-tRNA(Asn)/Glu-tRNA(Gln) amidotransferase A subunit family amidase
MTAPHQLSAFEAAQQLQNRQLSATALVQSCLERIDAREPVLHAFAHLDAQAALAQARALDAGPVRGLLHGLPLGIKDLFDTAQFRTTYGSQVYGQHRPALTAAPVTMCQEAGAVLMGKTMTTEFAYFTPGPTANPHNPAHTPGGSSSGSAASVGDTMLPLALGTQTAGSIIRPAAFCGVVGYKPSVGKVSGAGVKSLSYTLDVVGGFGRSVQDVGLLGAALSGDLRLIDGVREPQNTRLKVGLFQTPWWSEVTVDTVQAWELATKKIANHTVHDVKSPAGFEHLIDLQKEVMVFEMARALSFERVMFGAQLSDRLNELLRDGMAVSGERQATNLMHVATWRARMDELFGEHDVLITPSAAGEAPEGLGATGDPMFCRAWSLMGLPSVHLPFTQGAKGLPVGLQIVGRMGQDHLLLQAAAQLHQDLRA